MCKCTPSTPCAPPGIVRVNFRTFCTWRGDLEVYLVVLDRLLRATYKKGRQSFEEKGAPQTKSWLRLCDETAKKGHRFAEGDD